MIDLLVQALALERAGARGLDEFWEVAESGDFQLDGTPREVVNEVLSSLMDARNETLSALLAERGALHS